MSATTLLRKQRDSDLRNDNTVQPIDVVIPEITIGTKLNIRAIRDDWERIYFYVMSSVSLIVITGIMFLLIGVSSSGGESIVVQLLPFFLILLAYKLFPYLAFYWSVYGNCIAVGPNQYPQIYRVIKDACQFLDISMPTVLILQGHGAFDLYVAKRFSRRGVILITSNLVDEFSNLPSSREFMMYVGRQLGHIKAGHFRWWFFKEVFGPLSLWFYAAWRRRCHFTADRVGLLAAGQLEAAMQALYILTVGPSVAPSTNFREIVDQRSVLFESFWARVQLSFRTYPYMIDRIVRLHDFAVDLGHKEALHRVGVMPIEHRKIKSLPLLIIHGHDRLAMLELRTFLFSKFPGVAQKVMVSTVAASATLPEKFEIVAEGVEGAIALLTPDDTATTLKATEPRMTSRARQNVVVEVGWIWGRLGRKRCLLLARGEVEIPSDLSGIEIHKFASSPEECSEIIRGFIEQLEREL
jgi:Zn-dependent protease with chaperone function